MLWALYSLLSGFFLATSDAFAKKTKLEDDYIIAWSRLFFSLPVAFVILLLFNMPEVSQKFWWTMLILAPLEILLLITYIRAIRLSPLSLVLPLFNLTPVFLILTSFLILGELPSIIGTFGILLVVVGAYALNINMRKYGLLEPFKAIFREKGNLLMILAALIASISTNLGKIAVLNSSASFFAATHLLLLPILLSIMYFKRIKQNLNGIKSNLAMLFLVGITNGLMSLFHALAVALVIVPYMISIKRTNSIFGILYGHFLFKEEYIAQRLVGAAIMVVGAAIILLTQ